MSKTQDLTAKNAEKLEISERRPELTQNEVVLNISRAFEILERMSQVISAVMWDCDRETLDTFKANDALINICAQRILDLGEMPKLLEGDSQKLLPQIIWEGEPADLWEMIQKMLKPLGEQISDLLIENSTHPDELSTELICEILQEGTLVELTDKEARNLREQFGVDLFSIVEEDKDDEKESHPNYFLRFYADKNCALFPEEGTFIFKDGAVTLLCGSRRLFIPTSIIVRATLTD